MKLINAEIGIQLELQENCVQYLTVENPAIFVKIVNDIWDQANGRDGDFILSEKEKILPFSKNCFFISNPFAVNCNDKKILTKLYQEIHEHVQDELMVEQAEWNEKMQIFLKRAMDTVPYQLVARECIEVSDLLKVFEVKIYSESEDILEILIDYLRAMKRICGYQVAIFLNIKQFLNEKQLHSLYEICSYEKIYLVNLEGVKSKPFMMEKYLIIDEDMCIIEA